MPAGCLTEITWADLQLFICDMQRRLLKRLDQCPKLIAVDWRHLAGSNPIKAFVDQR